MLAKDAGLYYKDNKGTKCFDQKNEKERHAINCRTYPLLPHTPTLAHIKDFKINDKNGTTGN